MTKKRSVKIADEPRQRRGKGVNRRFEQDERSDLGPVRRVDRNAPLTIPTGDRRHASHIREGRISFEVFSRELRRRIPVDADIQEGGGKADNASQKLQEGSAEGVPSDDASVRPKEGKAGVLRDGKQARSRKKPDSKGKQRVPKTEINAQAAKRRKKKASMTKRGASRGK